MALPALQFQERQGVGGGVSPFVSPGKCCVDYPPTQALPREAAGSHVVDADTAATSWQCSK